MVDNQGALYDYNKVVELDSHNADAYFYRAIIKVVLKDYKGALSDYTKTIELETNNEYAYEKRAELYRKMADIEQNEEKKAEWIAKAESDENYSGNSFFYPWNDI